MTSAERALLTAIASILRANAYRAAKMPNVPQPEADAREDFETLSRLIEALHAEWTPPVPSLDRIEAESGWLNLMGRWLRH